MISLAVKYRPTAFSDVTEQASIKTILTQQLETGEFKHAYLFCGGAGTGKAQPMYSNILTPEGFIKMGKIKVGDKVFTHTGEITKVTDIFPQGKRPIYEITLQDKTTIRVADNHLNSVYVYNQKTKKREDYVLTTLELIDFIKKSKWRVRIDVPSVDWEEQDILIDPYLLGVLIGDGSLSGGNFSFSNVETDIICKVNDLLKSNYGMYLNGKYKDYKIQYITNPKHNGSRGDRGKHPLVRNYDVLSTLKGQLDYYGLLCKSVDKHIPKEYLLNSKDVRIALLQGLFDTDGYTEKGGATSFSTSSKQLSEDFAFLVRSLGIRDTVTYSVPKYRNSHGEEIECSMCYTHYLHIPKDFKYCTSKKHLDRYKNRQNEPIRNIIDIQYIGEEECQCIMVEHSDHTYISDNFIPTHNTTCARIFAAELNKGQGNPIELDAASNNGVDDVREIIKQAKMKPLAGEYKCFILDECVTGETEILTREGWKRIDSITELDAIAQYTKEGEIEFVEDWKYVKKEYSGDMYDVTLRNGKRHVLMSPHHVQPTRKIKSKELVEEYIQDVKFGQHRELVVSGKGTGNNEPLNSLDRLYIACQADGYCNKHYDKAFWELHLSIPEKITRALKLLDDCEIAYHIYGETKKSIRFYYEFPRTKKLKDYFDLDMGEDRAKDFIAEILLWDGSTKSGHPGYYSCTDKDNVDFVSAVLTMCGYSGTVNVTKYDNPNHKDVWNVNWYYKDYRTGQAISKKKIENWSGYIYCVKVPSQMIVLRAEGFTFISGNCHSISNAGWQAFLKIIEEPPKTSIFIFCTTNPEKIPKTILSRVQRYDFQKISNEGIVKRLHDICVMEEITLNNRYENALEYISKMAEGGMRDAITMLDKVLAFSPDITVENALKVLGTVDYDVMIELTECLLNYKTKSQRCIEIIESIHQEGKDLKQFVSKYIQFLIDLNKYYIGCDWKYISLPNSEAYVSKLDNLIKCQHDDIYIIDLVEKFIEIDTAIKYSATPRYDIEARLLLM